jgi:hypothetical protein
MTNGTGMMRFSRGFMRFGKGLPIVPAAVRAAPAFGISTHTLTSSFGANMFWFCFAPWGDLEVTVLPPMQPHEVCCQHLNAEILTVTSDSYRGDFHHQPSGIEDGSFAATAITRCAMPCCCCLTPGWVAGHPRLGRCFSRRAHRLWSSAIRSNARNVMCREKAMGTSSTGCSVRLQASWVCRSSTSRCSRSTN